MPLPARLTLLCPEGNMASLEDSLHSLTSDKLEEEFIPLLLKPLEHVLSFFSVLRYVGKSGGDLEGNVKL